jgi:hypothetical protein
MKAIGATSFISKSDTKVMTDSPKSHHLFFSVNHIKEQTLTKVCNTSPSEEPLHCDQTDARFLACGEI